MSRTICDPFTAKFPRLDIHGETTLTCIAPIKKFINNNITLKNKNIVIIHGKGSGALKKATHEYLHNNKLVNKYYLNGFNIGETIVELNINIKN